MLIKGEEKELARLFAEDQLTNLSTLQYEPYHKKHAPIAVAALFVAVSLATLGVMPIAGGAFVAAVHFNRDGENGCAEAGGGQHYAGGKRLAAGGDYLCDL